MAQVERHCTVLVGAAPEESVREEELRARLESRDPEGKAAALETLILQTLSGEPMPRLLMTVIKNCLRTRDHFLKKMLLVYWEVVEKTGPDGKLLPEMILICDALRGDLQHPNEYIRGITLRFLCKIKHQEILESLVPAIVDCLEHRHSYVRKNAVLALFEIFQTFSHLVPDAPQTIEDLLLREEHPSVRRNAFMMLFHSDLPRAVRYLSTVMDRLDSFDASFHMVFLELARKICRSTPHLKPYYLRAVYGLLNASSNTVAYEAASTLLALSAAPTAVASGIGTLVNLLTRESDNNVKLIILAKLEGLRHRHERGMQTNLLDLLRVLTTPNMVLRRRALDLCLQLLTPTTVLDVVQLLKKEAGRAEASDEACKEDYRQLLVQTIYACAVKFPQVAEHVVHLLLPFVADDSAAALDVTLFVREIMQEEPRLRRDMFEKLLPCFLQVRSVPVFHALLWVFGEFAREDDLVQAAIDVILASIGPVPLADNRPPQPESEGEAAAPVSRTVVLPDGSYAQQEVRATQEPTAAATEEQLRALLLQGDFFLGTSIAGALTKLGLRFAVKGGPKANAMTARILLVLSSMLRLGATYKDDKAMDHDARTRIVQCFNTLLRSDETHTAFLEAGEKQFAHLIASQRKEHGPAIETPIVQPDELIHLRQLRAAAPGEVDLEDDEANVGRAAGQTDQPKGSRLDRMVQLTGYADPLYAEACVTVHEFDIVLDVLVINQTGETLQNVSLDLSTSGALKIVERAQEHTVAPGGYVAIQSNIKVSSTEAGVIFGTLSYNDRGHGAQKKLVVLNSVHMDIVDYIRPATCSMAEFRRMWAEFEWENKIAVATEIRDMDAFIRHLEDKTRMKSLSCADADSGAGGFIAASLYTRSIFGEDALMSLSAEKTENGQLAGHIRIRSKTQGIALSLGDKVSASQRRLK